ncbi:MAG: thiosulfate/3-mercaptopyruvate sulfurtransferase [Solirubrobacteraceae bacterium]|jgi:thiosulfate/3-mercaptopyruvate sulfurtransferase|nr:thiosulfate/3-mercaptopyruvate sulfurtransferase [Solirubrobacteraceae bacterium]
MIPPVVDVAWVREHGDELVLADVRWYLDGRPGRAEYDAGHLPGAVFVDLDEQLAAEGAPEVGRHPLPDHEAFARDMAQLGIGDDDTVVAYDDAGGVMAARLVWMLRAIGRPAAVLDGGMAAWDGPLESRTPPRPPARFTPVPWPQERLASMDDAADPDNVVLDARQRERYLGAPDPIDFRAGHIPGARSLPCRANLDPSGRFLPVAELRRRLADVGVGPSTPVVSYCGSGVTACHNLLAIEHAGLGAGRLYPGSWSQWSHDVARPVATGDEETSPPAS